MEQVRRWAQGKAERDGMAEIIIVDDEQGIREFIAEALGGRGHRTVKAPDATEALRLLQASAFDLLVTDLGRAAAESAVGGQHRVGESDVVRIHRASMAASIESSDR